MTLKLVSLFPNHLDLNGDQANLKIARKRLEWLGHKVEIIPVQKGERLPADADLVLIGHGSMAAWNDIGDAFVSLVPAIKDLIQAGSALMAVATGHERCIQHGLFEGVIEERTRVSKFEIANLGDQEILGYLNSATSAPVIQKKELVLGTQLHGPIFAKNPIFLDSFLFEILSARDLKFDNTQVGSPEADNLRTKVDYIADIVENVWALERELASE